jgi:ubiquinone/menaquinone biosynthesis C-methylase UbiE
MFAQPAKDLVARLELTERARVLDVGAGTGVAALTAIKAAGPQAMVAAVDPSIAMLRTARENGVARIAAGTLPDLPFASASFDAVIASFVLSHVARCPEALRDVARVLQPGGRLGATAWGARKNEFRDLWQSLADSVAGKDELLAAVNQALPWEDRLSDPATFRSTLADAGLERVQIHSIDYRIHMTIADFLTIRNSSLQARFMQQKLGADGWQRFEETAAREFRSRFTDPIDHTRDVLIAIGRKGAY